MSDSDFQRFYLEENLQEPQAVVVTSIRLPVQTLASLDAISAFCGTTRSFVMQTILKNEAEKLDQRIFDETQGEVKEKYIEISKAAIEKLCAKGDSL